jgi:hypothetical protein
VTFFTPLVRFSSVFGGGQVGGVVMLQLFKQHHGVSGAACDSGTNVHMSQSLRASHAPSHASG